MKTRRITGSVLALSVLLLAGCQHTPLAEPQGILAGEQVAVKLGFTTRELETAQTKGAGRVDYSDETIDLTFGSELPQSKAAAGLTETAEQTINNLWVMQFDGTASTAAIVGEPIYLEAEDIHQTDDQAWVEGLSLTAATTTQTIYLVANTANSSLFSGAGKPGTIAALNAKTLALSAEYVPTAEAGLLMLSATETPHIRAGEEISAELTRMTAKINFAATVDTDFAASGFKVTSVQLRNVPKNFYYAPAPTAANFPASATGSHSDYPAETRTNAVWYLPENHQSLVGEAITNIRQRVPSRSNESKGTYIEIKGEANYAKATYTVMLGDVSASLGDFNVRRNHTYNVTLNIKGIDETDLRIEAEGQQANAYMVTPGGSVTFNAKVEGNSKRMTLQTKSVGLVWQDVQSLIPASGGIVYNATTGQVTVNTNNASGNALVAAYDGVNGTGNILWSWHIWVTDYKPLEYSGVTGEQNKRYTVPGGEVHTYGEKFMEVQLTANVTDHVIMDRNLGATKTFYAAPMPDAVSTADAAKTFGFFYQWGRKDPLPYWDGANTTGSAFVTLYNAADAPVTSPNVNIASIQGSEVNTQAYATVNPLAFIFATTNPFDWYTTTVDNRNDNLWGDGATKSKYDPCPAGWRIGKNGTANDFGTDPYSETCRFYIKGVAQTASNTPVYEANALNGRLYAATGAWIPAAGQRTRNGGGLLTLGQLGYSAWSTVTGSNCYFMDYTQSTLRPSTAYHRAIGFQVRCVRE